MRFQTLRLVFAHIGTDLFQSYVCLTRLYSLTYPDVGQTTPALIVAADEQRDDLPVVVEVDIWIGSHLVDEFHRLPLHSSTTTFCYTCGQDRRSRFERHSS